MISSRRRDQIPDPDATAVSAATPDITSPRCRPQRNDVFAPDPPPTQVAAANDDDAAARERAAGAAAGSDRPQWWRDEGFWQDGEMGGGGDEVR